MEGQFPHFVVLTQTATENIAFIHDRMPLMLPEEAVGDWINPRNSNPSKLLPLALTEMNYQIAENAAKEGL
jgi:putative SOS response-associated peptidase YedK